MIEFEQLVGKENVGEWIQITQDLVDRFGRLTKDEQWIHMDIEKARKFKPETGTIAHGFLTLSLISYIMKEVLSEKMKNIPIKSTINYGINRLRFVNPVPVGHRIRGRITLNEIKWGQNVPSAQGIFGVVIDIEGIDKPAMVSEHVILYQF